MVSSTIFDIFLPLFISLRGALENGEWSLIFLFLAQNVPFSFLSSSALFKKFTALLYSGLNLFFFRMSLPGTTLVGLCSSPSIIAFSPILQICSFLSSEAFLQALSPVCLPCKSVSASSFISFSGRTFLWIGDWPWPQKTNLFSLAQGAGGRTRNCVVLVIPPTNSTRSMTFLRIFFSPIFCLVARFPAE